MPVQASTQARLGAVVALAARQAQTQGASPLIGQDVDRGAEAAPVAIEGGIPPFFEACPPRARPTVLSSSAADSSGSSCR